MKKISSFLFAVSLLMLAGCGLTTLHPIFTPGDLIMDTHLMGKWENEKTWYRFDPASQVALEDIPEKLQQFSSKFYLLTTDKGRNLAFLIKIGDHHFLDVYPIEGDAEKDIDPFYKLHKVRMHTVHRLDYETPSSFRLQNFEDSYLENLIHKKQLRIAYTNVKNSDTNEEDIVITASTNELQQFLSKYGSDINAYDKEEEKIFTQNKITKHATQ